MCVKFFSENLNPNSYPSHPTSTYTCVVTIAHNPICIVACIKLWKKVKNITNFTSELLQLNMTINLIGGCQ